MKEYLTDLELEKIEALCKDEVMYEAVRKVLLAQVYYSGALKKGEKLEPKNQAYNLLATAYQAGNQVSNELLGQELRAQYEGVNMVEQAFAQLKRLKVDKKGEPVESPYNDAI